jgi:hypothetical protein
MVRHLRDAQSAAENAAQGEEEAHYLLKLEFRKVQESARHHEAENMHLRQRVELHTPERNEVQLQKRGAPQASPELMSDADAPHDSEIQVLTQQVAQSRQQEQDALEMAWGCKADVQKLSTEATVTIMYPQPTVFVPTHIDPPVPSWQKRAAQSPVSS